MTYLIHMWPLRFNNRFIDVLPCDPEVSLRSRQVLEAWSGVAPTPVPVPCLLAYSSEVAAILNFDAEELVTPRFVEVFSGNALYPGMQPYAVNYGGHQFGQWVGQLGDGRVITLGELLGADGVYYELQLKGLDLRRIRVVLMAVRY